jgi:recombination protein RecA
LLSKYKTALIGINQIREDIDNPYNLYSTPGGKAWKHLCALRMLFRKGFFIDDDNKEVPQNKALEPKGNVSDVKIEKTKVCRPDRRVGFQTIKYDVGIDVLADTVDIAIKYGFVFQSGSWFNLIDPETGEILADYDSVEDKEIQLKFQGKPALLEYLRTNEATFTELYDAVNAKVKEF